MALVVLLKTRYLFVVESINCFTTRNFSFHRMIGIWCVVCCAFGAIGCGESGPKLGSVTGVVTIDGKPEPELLVIYEPQIPKGTNPTGGTAGGPSSGMTDSEGMFELVYRDGKRKGAVVGPHLVRITSAKGGGGAGGETGETQLGIPARYNFKTKLTADVTEGENEPKTYELVIGEPSQKKQK